MTRHLAIAAALLAVHGCTPNGSSPEEAPSNAGEPAAPARGPEPAAEPDLDPVALKLIDRLDENGHQVSMTGDQVTAPESFGLLVGMGPEALPTILHVAEMTDDEWTRVMLIDIAGRIGDLRARPLLTRFLRAERPDIVSEAISALGRLGSAESIPALRQLLGKRGTSSDGGFQRLQVLEAILRCGDESVVADILAMGLAGQDRFYAAQILARHQPLRDALGFEGPYREGGAEFVDEALFFPAADEWYREAVLGEPPRRHAAEFSQPFQDEKRAAWATLLKACQDEDSRCSNIRACATDPTLASADATRALTVVSGYGHGQGLEVLAWRADAGGRLRGHRFVFRGGEPNSAFPEDCGTASYSTLTLGASEYAGLVAGLRTILEARLSPWWAGPGLGSMMSTGDFAVSIRGAGELKAASVSFCGYPGSENRLEYTAPRAALTWTRAYLAKRPPFSSAEADATAKRVFSEVFRCEQPQWGSRANDWWWVRERMVLLAGAFGDETLRGPLAAYLAPEFVNGPHSLSRTAAKACSALASITGRDLRFASDGSPRALREVAKLYRALLETR